MGAVRLDIISDPVCPWCYIGKARLDRALECRPDHPFVVERHPFQLNPDMAAQGMDRREHLAAKYGAERALAGEARIMEHAADAGIEIDFARATRVPNTLDAHRLIHWAGLEGCQTPVVSALFRAYFREGRDIGDSAELTDIGAGAGLERAVITRLLAGDADRDLIAGRDAYARQRGINAVPTFIIADRHVAEGAQPTDLWLRVIDELAAALAEADPR